MQACRELGTARRDSAQHARTAPRGRLRTREARPYYYSTDFSCATVHRRRCRGPSTTTSLDQRPAPRRRTPAVVERSTPMMFRTIRSALRPARPSSKERRDDVHSGRRSGRQRRHQAPLRRRPSCPDRTRWRLFLRCGRPRRRSRCAAPRRRPANESTCRRVVSPEALKASYRPKLN